MAYLKSEDAHSHTHTLYRVIQNIYDKINSGSIDAKEGDEKIRAARKQFLELKKEKQS